MKKLIVFFVIIILALFAGGVFGKSVKTEDAKLVSDIAKGAVSVTPDTRSQPVPLSKPSELSIPKLGIQSPIEYVGNDALGNMDVPKNDMHVAWYEPGFHPGDTGNAVIAGHFDRKDGGPAVFYQLETLEKGDEIVLTDENANMLRFSVVEKDTYSAANFPIATVFGPSQKRYLNLITCEGVFDPKAKLYSDRLVVRAELKE